MSQKAKMCKSPKNIVYAQSDRIEYENLNTNCTIVGSNNLHLVKKPQIVTSMSPAYSNPSPGYPPSPYSSPASLKSPSPQLNMKPPTPQPNTFPVMQIIHNSHPVIARPIHATQQQNVIKLKPPLNILPKPSASPQQSPKPSVSPQIVLPASQQATIMPTAQPLLLNQMPMLAPGVQFILRPQTAKLPPQVQQTPQGLILQQGGQQLLQIQPPRSQPMMRVLANGMGIPTTTYVTHMTPQNNIQQQSAPPPQSTPPKKKANKKKKQKLDLANIMKLSGIGDDDDVQFESDTSQSESEHNAHSQPVTPQPTTPTIMQQPPPPVGNMMQPDNKTGAKLGNIQISAVPQAISAAGTPLMQVLNQPFQGAPQNQQGQPTSIPFNPFVTPNFTINNGLMVQRSGGFKLALGEDGRLVLQHDPTLNQDLQSQLLLQSIFGLNGQLVLQPSIDQQIHSQTVQTIQQQSVQTIQQQTVQSQTIQTVQHQIVQPQALQSIQSQIQGQIQSMLQQQNLGSQSIAIQPQNITIQPQGIQGLQVSQPLSIQSQSLGIQSQAQPLTIQSHSQPVTIQTQSLPLTIQSHTPHHNQIINLSQANQIFTSNNLQQQPQMQLQQRTPQPQQQVLPQPASTQTQTTMIQQPHTFTHNSTPNQTVSLSSQPTMGTQPVLKVQPFQKSQPPVQTVHPIHHTHNHHQQQQQPPPPPTSYVVNLTPDQLEQLKRNGQLTVNGQTIFMQRPNKTDEKKTSPKIKPMKKVSKIPTVVKENRAVNNLEKTINNVVKESVKAIHLPNHKQVSVQTQPPKTQPAAIIQPQPAKVVQPTKIHVQPTVVVQPAPPPQPPPPVIAPTPPPQPEVVERYLGPIMDDSPAPPPPPPQQPPPPAPQPAVVPPTSNIVINSAASIPTTQPTQRVHTIQLTPQKQQHLKSIQLQIQTLSARLTPGNTEMQNALKLLFQEQQKILATGKLLPPDKVFYHNNQLIVNSGVGLVKNEVASAPQPVKPPVVVATTATNGPVTEKITTTTANTILPSVVPIAPAPPPKLVVSASVAPTAAVPAPAVVPPVQKIAPAVTVVAPSQPPQQQTRFIPMYTKAQLIEQQLNTDQNGAVKPDIHTGFKDKADACKRLIRYHCFEQPVLSQKDLDKADEIFELTARHFIDKFGRMADKYRFLLHKESQRHVQTSELMMLDRMFLAEEQQSLIRMRQEIDECNLEMQQQNAMQTGDPMTEPPMNSEEYDEWACIQRELGCLPLSEEGKMSATTTTTTTVSASSTSPVSTTSVKRSSSADSRLETLKKFRVEKHCKKTESDYVVKPGRNQNVHCTTVLSSSSVVHGTTTNIQSNYQERTMQHNSSIGRTIVSSSNGTSCSIAANRINRATNQVAPMEPLGSSTPIQSGSGNPLHNIHNSLHSYNAMQLQNPIQRLHGMPNVHQNFHPLQHVVHNSTQQALLQRNVQHYSTQHIVQHITHTVHHTQQMHGGSTQNSVHHSSSVHSSQNSYSSGNEELDNNDSIDEQVQSAIDSILNLQQNTSLELDETMQNMLS